MMSTSTVVLIKMKLRPAFAVCLLLLPFAAGAAPYQPLKEIPLGGEGGWDCLSIDKSTRRLFVSHSTKVDVVDLTTSAKSGEIADTPGVHAIAFAADLGRAFVSNGKDNSVSIVDLHSLKTLSKTPTGENPDVVLFDSGRGEIYALNGRGQSATVIEAKTGKVVATVALPGRPEFAEADSAAGRVYCNLEDKSAVAVIDTAKHEVVATWPIAPGEEPTGLALDAEHHRLFIACSNKMMVMMDSQSGKVLAQVPIGSGVDGCAYDPATQLAFAPCGEGSVTIAKAEGDKLSVVQVLPTQRGARTMTLDPASHRIYLPTAEFGPMPSPAPEGQRPRPPILPGSFKLLVYGPGE